MKLTIIDSCEMKSNKTGKPFRLVSLMYESQNGFIQAGTYFVPSSYTGPIVPDTTMNGCIYDGKLIELTD